MQLEQVSHQPNLVSLRGRRALLLSWLSTSPFTKSFIEDEEKGTARTTRFNTLANRNSTITQSDSSAAISKPSDSVANLLDITTANASNTHLPITDKRQQSPSRRLIEPSSLSSLTTLSDGPHRSISFADEVHVYADEPSCVPVVEKVKLKPSQPSLKTCTRLPPEQQLDEFTPQSAVGKWLLRKVSSDNPPCHA